VPCEAARLADLGPAPRERPLRLAEGHADPERLVFGGIAEQLVHLRPESLLFETERAVDVGGASAVPARCLPSADALVEHADIHTGAREPPSGTEPGDASPDDDHCRPVRPFHGAGMNIPRCRVP